MDKDNKNYYSLGYGYLDGHGIALVPEWTCSDYSLANASAQMWLYLKSHNLLP